MASKRRTPASARATAESEPAKLSEPKRSEAVSDLMMRPSVNAAAIVATYAKPIGAKDEDIGVLMNRLSDDMKGMWSGDMKRAEAMLFAQAHALQSIFMGLALRADSKEYLKQWEAYLRLALKAQNQCRMTLETLATIKNPPVVIAKQANINHGGQQQVNNGLAPGKPTNPRERAPARAEIEESAPTELLEANHGQGLDTGAAGAAGGVDSRVATVGAVDRPPHR